MTQSGQIVEIYKSRKNLVSLLKRQEYDVSNYSEFSIHEVNTMFHAKQLDMLFTKQDGSKKAYVKYHLSKSLRPVNIYEYIDDLFNLEEVLTKTDDLIIIMKDEPNETTEKTLSNIWEQDGVFVTIYNIKRLQYNVLEHSLVPPHYALTEEEGNAIKTKYNILTNEQIPDISRFSPVAQAIGLRPGQMCHIVRPSKTAISADFYRVCT
jgi:DNA-directed RNA polymerase subunit H (RpoH/RPB5)